MNSVSQYLRKALKSKSERNLLYALFITIVVISFLIILNLSLKEALYVSARESFGADLIVDSENPLPSFIAEKATQNQLKQAKVTQFFTMLSTTEFILSKVKAVDEAYPLLGNIIIENPQGQQTITHGPAPGEIWVEKRLQEKLGLSFGQKVAIGKMELTFAAILVKDNAPLSGLNVFAPLALMHDQDVEAAGIILPGSRVDFERWFQGNADDIARFISDIEQDISDNIEIEAPNRGSTASARVLERGQYFLSVVTMVVALLGGIAIFYASKIYGMHKIRWVALLKTIGVSKKVIIRDFFLSLFILGSFTVLSGILFSFLIVQVFQGFWPDTLPFLLQFSLQGGLFAYLIGIVVLLNFTMPLINRLMRISPIEIFAQSTFEQIQVPFWQYAIGPMLLLIATYFYVDSPRLLLTFVGAFLAFGFIAFVLVFMAVQVMKKAPIARAGLLGFSLRQLNAKEGQTIQILSAFTLLFALAFFLYILQNEMLKDWESTFPENTPNHFMVNLAENDVDAMKALFTSNDIDVPVFYPIIRGRLTYINDDKLGPEEEGLRKGLTRALNLTWQSTLPKDNEVVAGIPWSERGQEQVISIEQGFADRLNIKLGDTLTFEILGQNITAKVVNIRTVQWASFKPNFFVIFSENILQDYPATYISSFYLKPTERDFVASILSQYPEVTVLDVEMILNEFKNLLAKISRISYLLISMIFIMTLLIMHLITHINMKERQHFAIICRAFGASKRFIIQSICVEYALIALVSLSVAFLISYGIAMIMSQQLFNIQIQFGSFDLIWISFIIAFILIGFGALSHRKVYKTSPLDLLRQ